MFFNTLHFKSSIWSEVQNTFRSCGIKMLINLQDSSGDSRWLFWWLLLRRDDRVSGDKQVLLLLAAVHYFFCMQLLPPPPYWTHKLHCEKYQDHNFICYILSHQVDQLVLEVLVREKFPKLGMSLVLTFLIQAPFSNFCWLYCLPCVLTSQLVQPCS